MDALDILLGMKSSSSFMGAISECTKPKQLGFTLTKPGSPTGWFARWHKHKFLWVDAPDGKSFISVDDLDSYMATYTSLHRCKCGAEGVNRVRALY